MSNRSRIPSPSRNQNIKITPRRRPPRVSSSKSIGSPGRPLRLSTLAQRLKDDEISLPENLSNYNKSVLSDNTNIVEPRRRSWWKAANMMSILDDDANRDVNDVIGEFEDEVMSQSSKYDTLDLPESSGSESIASIIIPEKHLLSKKQQMPKKFPRVSESRTLQKSFDNEKTIALKASPKKLFKKTGKRSRPHFPDALLNMSTIANKTSGDKTIEVKAPLRTLLNNRGSKRKNMFQNFVLTESDDDISDVQPNVFGFHKSGQPNTQVNRPQSPSSSIASDLDTHWNLLPSSTMMEDFGFERETPGKKAKLSKISNISALREEMDVEYESNNVNIEDDVQVGRQAISKQRKSANITNKSLKENSSIINKSKRVSIDNINVKDIPELIESNETHKDKSKSSENSFNNTVKEKSKQNNSQIANKSLSKSLNKSKRATPKSIQEELEVAKEMNIESGGGGKETSVHDRDIDAIDYEINESMDIDKSVLESEKESEEQIEDDVSKDDKQEENVDVKVNEKLLESLKEEQMEYDEKQQSEEENVNMRDKSEVSISRPEGEEQNSDEDGNKVNNENQEKINMEDDNGGMAVEKLEKVDIEDDNMEQKESGVVEKSEDSDEMANDNRKCDESAVADQNDDNEENNDQGESAVVDDENKEEDKIADDNEEQDESAVVDDENEEEDEIADGNEKQEESAVVDDENKEEDDIADGNEEQEESAVVDDENEEDEIADGNEEQEESAVVDENEEEDEIADDNVEQDESAEVANENDEEESAEIANENYEEESVEIANDTEQEESEGVEENEDLDEIVDDNEEVEESAEVANESEELEESEHIGDENEEDEIEEQNDHDESASIQQQEESDITDDVQNERSEQIEADDQSLGDRADAKSTLDANLSLNKVTQVHDTVSQHTFISFLEKIKRNNLAKQEQIRETFKSTTKPRVITNNNMPTFKRITKPKPRPLNVPTEFKPKRKIKAKFNAETLAALPKDFYEDLKYKPPKRYTPPNSSWATKRLYAFLENKLEPRYDYMARIQAEKFVNKLFMFSKQIKQLNVAPRDLIEKLQYRMAALSIIETYCDFFDFFRDFLPKEIRIKVIPDIINKLPLPPQGIHSRIIQENSNA